jgi:hypothetical protein
VFACCVNYREEVVARRLHTAAASFLFQLDWLPLLLLLVALLERG